MFALPRVLDKALQQQANECYRNAFLKCWNINIKLRAKKTFTFWRVVFKSYHKSLQTCSEQHLSSLSRIKIEPLGSGSSYWASLDMPVGLFSSNEVMVVFFSRAPSNFFNGFAPSEHHLQIIIEKWKLKILLTQTSTPSGPLLKRQK